VEADERTSPDTIGRIKGLVLAALLSPLYFLFIHFDEETRGFVVFCATGVACIAAYVQRKEHNRVQLWLLVGFVYLLELPVALLVPLPDRLPGATMIPISFLNLFLFLGVISLFQRWRGGGEALK
jgi:hypothetical protein